MNPLSVLIVEDSPADATLMVRALKGAGFEPLHERVDTADAMQQALERQSWDVVLSDYSMPAFDAPAALAVLREHDDDIPFIVVSGSVGEDAAVAIMQAGAADYVMKDRLARLGPAVVSAVEGARVRRDRERLEQQLQEAQRLEAIGRLAGGVAHDFNNVLTAILGSSELLFLDAPAGQPPREELHNDIKLVTELAPDLAAVRADPGQLEQVLVNLAVNARDAMPNGGTITIKSYNAAVREGDAAPDHVPPGRYAVLQLSDTGVGMDAETQARIFEPFFTTKERGKGTGLGLATVYGIVRQSGGHIAVESAPGAGSSFRLYLPEVHEPVAPTRGPGPVARPVTGTETVLLAEDEPLVRLLARRVLEQAGYKVLVAAGGSEALEAAEHFAGPIHLLLTDVVMPEMNGRVLAQRVTALRPAIRVLYMTGYADEAVAKHGVLDPGTALIQKPFTPAALARKVREALEGGAAEARS